MATNELIINQLEQDINFLIEEKTKILRQIEFMLFSEKYHFSDDEFDILSTHSIAILYATWEGFILDSFSLYIKALNSLNINFSEYNKNIIIFHMENTFKQFGAYPQKNKQKLFFFQSLKEFYNIPQQPLSNTVNTKKQCWF